LLRALRRDPVAWRRYVRTVGAQTMAVVLLALVFLLIGDGPDGHG
jgi:heme A synthase